MKILKKLKLRTKLQKQLNNIDDYLYKSHYYENDLKLNTSKFCSDEYTQYQYYSKIRSKITTKELVISYFFSSRHFRDISRNSGFSDRNIQPSKLLLEQNCVKFLHAIHGSLSIQYSSIHHRYFLSRKLLKKRQKIGYSRGYLRPSDE